MKEECQRAPKAHKMRQKKRKNASKWLEEPHFPTFSALSFLKLGVSKGIPFEKRKNSKKIEKNLSV